MRKRIEALLLGKLKHATPGLPCGGGISIIGKTKCDGIQNQMRLFGGLS